MRSTLVNWGVEEHVVAVHSGDKVAKVNEHGCLIFGRYAC